MDTAGGADAISPTSGAFVATEACSTFSVYDSLIALFGDKSMYPNLKQVVVLGHSNGGATVIRYSIFHQHSNGLPIRFAAANSPTAPYFTQRRPWASNDSSINSWIYGFDGGLSSYVAARMKDLPTLFREWCAKDVRTLTGNMDTYAR